MDSPSPNTVVPTPEPSLTPSKGQLTRSKDSAPSGAKVGGVHRSGCTDSRERTGPLMGARQSSAKLLQRDPSESPLR